MTTLQDLEDEDYESARELVAERCGCSCELCYDCMIEAFKHVNIEDFYGL